MAPVPQPARCWDIFAVSTYATVSLLFWYVGLLPDLRDDARSRDAPRRSAASYGDPLRWAGAATGQHWAHYQKLYVLLAGLAAPLGASRVHSVVWLDFAISIAPGWHSTIFPPYFVAGALFSGFAMVLTLVDPAAQTSTA